MKREELLEKYFIFMNEMDMYTVKPGFVVKLDLFSEDYVSSIVGNEIYSMASDNTYNLQKVIDNIKIYKEIT
jgi:hypothetical protein